MQSRADALAKLSNFRREYFSKVEQTITTEALRFRSIQPHLQCKGSCKEGAGVHCTPHALENYGATHARNRERLMDARRDVEFGVEARCGIVDGLRNCSAANDGTLVFHKACLGVSGWKRQRRTKLFRLRRIGSQPHAYCRGLLVNLCPPNSLTSAVSEKSTTNLWPCGLPKCAGSDTATAT